MLAIYAPGPFRRVANLNGIWIECIILYELPSEAKNMVMWVVEFLSGGYKIRKIFAWESTYPKEILEFWKLVQWGGVKIFDFQSQFSMPKIIRIFLITKMMPYFWQLAINPKLKIQ